MDQKQDEQRIREEITRMDGEQLLRQVAMAAGGGQTGPSEPSLLDANGQPINPPKQALVPQGNMRTQLEMMHEQAERRRIKTARAFGEILKSSKDLENVYDVFFTAWEIIWWCRMEMSVNPDMTDEMIEDLDHIVQAKLYRDKGYDLRKVFNHMRDRCLPIVRDFISRYDSASKVRKARFDGIKKRTGGRWPQLPFDVDPEHQPKELKPGQVVVLQGTDKANGMALIAVCMAIVQQQERFVYFGAEKLKDVEGFEKHGCTFVPEVFWKNIAASNSKLLESLEMTVKDTHLALVVSDLGKLYEDDKKLSEIDRKGFALKRLYAWAVENLVSVVVCDNVEKHTEGRGAYGYIPYVRVSFEDGMLKAEGRPVKGCESSSQSDTPKDSSTDGKA